MSLGSTAQVHCMPPAQVPPSEASSLAEEYDVMPHELPTYLFIEVATHNTCHRRLRIQSFRNDRYHPECRAGNMELVLHSCHIVGRFRQTNPQDKNEMDKLATGLSYQQLNGSGVTTDKLKDQISIVFRI